MDLKVFNKMKKQIKEAVNKMLEVGYKEEELRVIFNSKYKENKFFDNIYLEYENFTDEVEFVVVTKYATWLRDRYPFKERYKYDR